MPIIILGPTIVGAPTRKQAASIARVERGAFQIEKQRKDKWCWAAVSVSVDHYFSPGSTTSQCQLAKEVLEDILKTVLSCCSNPDECNVPAKT